MSNIKGICKSYGQHFMDGFNEFVHSYYNRGITVLRGSSLISQYSDSEEEAFDKFFELLDEFLEQKADAKWRCY